MFKVTMTDISNSLSGSHHLHLTLMMTSLVHLTLAMTSAQAVETSVNVTPNSPSQIHTHPDDHNLPNYGKKYDWMLQWHIVRVGIIHCHPDQVGI